MNFSETLQYLYNSLPVFQRIGAAAYKADLNNTLALCNALDNPQNKFKSVHVAGTNGKGSSSHMIAAVLQSAGYRTGLYTSPHLKEFTERIRIDGREVSQAYVVDFVRRIKPVLEDIKPSFFEATVAMAFDYFTEQKVDVAVIEVGLGGRLDSTNVITPLVSLITNIGYDHMEFLGATLPLIAGEKAGIIKPSVPVVVSQRQQEVEDVFIAKAKAVAAPLRFADDELKLVGATVPGVFTVMRDDSVLYKNLVCELKGGYQARNIPGVLAALEVMKEAGFRIDESAIRKGIGGVATITGLKGRWQKLGEHPLVICDTGHNEDGIREVVRQIQMEKFKMLHVVFGTVNDKDITKILGLLPKDASYYFCQAKIPRALAADLLAAKAAGLGLHGVVIPDVNDAIAKAKEMASKEDLIFIGGSTFVVADINGL